MVILVFSIVQTIFFMAESQSLSDNFKYVNKCLFYNPYTL